MFSILWDAPYSRRPVSQVVFFSCPCSSFLQPQFSGRQLTERQKCALKSMWFLTKSPFPFVTCSVGLVSTVVLLPFVSFTYAWAFWHKEFRISFMTNNSNCLTMGEYLIFSYFMLKNSLFLGGFCCSFPTWAVSSFPWCKHEAREKGHSQTTYCIFCSFHVENSHELPV